MCTAQSKGRRREPDMFRALRCKLDICQSPKFWAFLKHLISGMWSRTMRKRWLLAWARRKVAPQRSGILCWLLCSSLITERAHHPVVHKGTAQLSLRTLSRDLVSRSLAASKGQAVALGCAWQPRKKPHKTPSACKQRQR